MSQLKFPSGYIINEDCLVLLTPIFKVVQQPRVEVTPGAVCTVAIVKELTVYSSWTAFVQGPSPKGDEITLTDVAKFSVILDVNEEQIAESREYASLSPEDRTPILATLRRIANINTVLNQQALGGDSESLMGEVPPAGFQNPIPLETESPKYTREDLMARFATQTRRLSEELLAAGVLEAKVGRLKSDDGAIQEEFEGIYALEDFLKEKKIAYDSTLLDALGSAPCSYLGE